MAFQRERGTTWAWMSMVLIERDSSYVCIISVEASKWMLVYTSMTGLRRVVILADARIECKEGLKMRCWFTPA
jgi:hypothetical protein